MSEAPLYRDRLPAADPGGAQVVATFAPDRARYIRDHVTLAAVFGMAVALLLLVLGRGEVLWAGIAGVLAALALRGVWFYPDAMRVRWLLTAEALLGPGGERIALGDIVTLRSLMGDVQVVTRGGRKLLIRHLADPAGAIRAIEAAR